MIVAFVLGMIVFRLSPELPSLSASDWIAVSAMLLLAIASQYLIGMAREELIKDKDVSFSLRKPR